MRRVISLVFAASLALAALGCKDASVELVKLADKSCACKDAECGKKVLGELAQWIKDNPRARGDEQKAEEAVQRLGKCLTESGIAPKELMQTLGAAAQ